MATLLFRTRGVNCIADQIIIFNNTDATVDLLFGAARILGRIYVIACSIMKYSIMGEKKGKDRRRATPADGALLALLLPPRLQDFTVLVKEVLHSRAIGSANLNL